MTAAEAIAMLDSMLLRNGEDVVLQKIVAGSVSASVTCRAIVRGYRPEELLAGIVQEDRQVIISPTEIDAAAWPGGADGPEDEREPVKGDRVKIAGRVHAIEAATGIRLAGTLVRIEMQVRG
jgi:stage V sporulation protein SpoVS